MAKKAFVLLKTADEEYKLKFSSGALAQLEASNKIPVSEIMGKMDSISTQLDVLWASLQKFHHGIEKNKASDIYDAFLEKGGTMEDFILLLMEAFEVSGFIPKGAVEIARIEQQVAKKKMEEQVNKVLDLPQM